MAGNHGDTVYIYDTTLRDGAQGEGISFTVQDKLKIARKLDALGVHYIEAGNPGSNPKDLEFFTELSKLRLENARPVAFGSTRRARMRPEDDKNLAAILQAETPTVAIFGKSWDFHVTHILGTTRAENLNMIASTIAFMKQQGKEVIFDAEHYFDGYKADAGYALDTLRAAAFAGADWIILCDTNGGTLTGELAGIVEATARAIETPLGIHCHNDSGVAVANSLAAVEKGARQIHGTINGYGERCGNADLCTIIPNLMLKLGYASIGPDRLGTLTRTSRYVSEVANLAHDRQAPFVGRSAFAHKGGMHIDAVMKETASFEHIRPELVGNERRVLLSEVSGRSTILARIQRLAPDLDKNSDVCQHLIDTLKRMEYEGYQFEGADASFDLLVRRTLGMTREFFRVKDFRVICEEPDRAERVENSAYSMINVEVEGVREITAADGDGPINALDLALRKALTVFYPELKGIKLVDYKVRVLDSKQATGSKVRVQIETSDGTDVWGTIGVSTNIVEASWSALVDSIEYFLYQQYETETKTQI